MKNNRQYLQPKLKTVLACLKATKDRIKELRRGVNVYVGSSTVELLLQENIRIEKKLSKTAHALMTESRK